MVINTLNTPQWFDLITSLSHHIIQYTISNIGRIVLVIAFLQVVIR